MDTLECGSSPRIPDFWSRNVYYAGTRSQSQNPIGAFEGHLSHSFKPRLWVSLDGNFWFGGKTTVNGVQNPLTRQTNSRLGGTVAVPISKHQSLKFSYSDGTYIRYRRELPERLGRLAVLLAGKTQIADVASIRRSRTCGRFFPPSSARSMLF